MCSRISLLRFFAISMALAIGVAASGEKSRVIIEPGGTDPQWLRDNIPVLAENGLTGIVYSNATWQMGDRRGSPDNGLISQGLMRDLNTNPWAENLEVVLAIPRNRSAQYGLENYLRFRLGLAVGGCLPWWEDDTAWGHHYRSQDLQGTEKPESFLEQAARFAGAARRNGLKGVMIDFETSNGLEHQVSLPNGGGCSSTPEMFSFKLLFSEDAAGPFDNGSIPPYVGPIRDTARHRGRQLIQAFADSFPGLELLILPEILNADTTATCVTCCPQECQDRPLWFDLLTGIVEGAQSLPSDRRVSRIIVIAETYFKSRIGSGPTITSSFDDKLKRVLNCLHLVATDSIDLNDRFEVGTGGWYLGGNGDVFGAVQKIALPASSYCCPPSECDVSGDTVALNAAVPRDTILCNECGGMPAPVPDWYRVQSIPYHTKDSQPHDFFFSVPWDVAEREITQNLYQGFQSHACSEVSSHTPALSRTQYIFTQEVPAWSDLTNWAATYAYPDTSFASYGQPWANCMGMYPPYQYLLRGKPAVMNRGFPKTRGLHGVAKDTALSDFLRVIKATRPLADSLAGPSAYKIKNPGFEGDDLPLQLSDACRGTFSGSLRHTHFDSCGGSIQHPLSQLVADTTAACGGRYPKHWQVAQEPGVTGGGLFLYVNPEEGNYQVPTDNCPFSISGSSRPCCAGDTIDVIPTALAYIFLTNHAVQMSVSGYQGQLRRGRMYQEVVLEKGTWELGALIRADYPASPPLGHLNTRFFAEKGSRPIQFGAGGPWHDVEPEPEQTSFNNERRGWYYRGYVFHADSAGTYRVGIATELSAGEHTRVDDVTLTRQGRMLRNPQFDYQMKPTEATTSPWVPVYWEASGSDSTFQWPRSNVGNTCPGSYCLGRHGPMSLETKYLGQPIEVSQSIYFEGVRSFV